MKVEVLNTKGKGTGRKVDLPAEVFGVEPNDHCIWLDVKHYRATIRSGTHKTKERSEVVGSRRKIKKQKGTGTARAGNAQNPLFKGGGRIFGPKPRDYSFKLNKKVKRLARLSALSHRANDEAVMIVEDFTLENVKTKDFADILKNLGVDAEKTLLVLKEKDNNVYLSARNLPKTKVMTAMGINTYSILDCKKIIFAEGAIDVLKERFSKN